MVAGNEIAKSVRTGDRLAFLRQYPQGSLYAAVTGYYSLVIGNAALEHAENDVLAGSDPRLFVRRLADLFTGRDPAGGDVVLTLDPAAQKAAMAGLKGVTGAVVALDPATGKVLAMASTPPTTRTRSRATTRRRSAAPRPSWRRSSPTRGSTRPSASATRRVGVQADRLGRRPVQRQVHAPDQDSRADRLHLPQSSRSWRTTTARAATTAPTSR